MPSDNTKKDKFNRLLHKYIEFRGIDIVLYLRSGEVIELDKNRCIQGEFVVKKNSRQQVEQLIPIVDISKADFFAA